MAAAVYPRPTTIQNLGLADIAAHTERVKEGIMTQASTTLIHRYSGVAIVVAVISGFGTFTATRFVTASSAQPAPAAAKPLICPAARCASRCSIARPAPAALRTGIPAITPSAT